MGAVPADLLNKWPRSEGFLCLVNCREGYSNNFEAAFVGNVCHSWKVPIQYLIWIAIIGMEEDARLEFFPNQ